MSRPGCRIAFVSLLFVAVSCTTASVPGGSPFVAPLPPDEDASGLTIGFIPEGFSFVWNEGHETATFHVFQTDAGSRQLSVGVQTFPPPHDSGPRERVTRGGREFEIYDEGRRIRVTERLADDTRIDVLGDSLDVETLLRVAESVSYQPIDG